MSNPCILYVHEKPWHDASIFSSLHVIRFSHSAARATGRYHGTTGVTEESFQR